MMASAVSRAITPCIDERVAEASAFLQDDSPHPEEWCGVYDILEIHGGAMMRALFIIGNVLGTIAFLQGSTALYSWVCYCETIPEHRTPRRLIVSRGSRVSSRYPRRAAHGAEPRRGLGFFYACITHKRKGQSHTINTWAQFSVRNRGD
jgi:hypothetical protein